MSGILRSLRGRMPQLVILLVMLAAVGLCYWRPLTATLFGRPPYPSQWDKIKRGMSREEAIAVAGDDFFDNAETKGFLLWRHKLDDRGVRWDLCVFFDENRKVRAVYADFVDPDCGDVRKSVTLVAGEERR